MTTDPLQSSRMAKSTTGEVSDDAVREALRRLIEVNRDSEKGFAKAAEHLDDESLSATFRNFAAERGRFANELGDMALRFGAEQSERGSIKGALHRAWINLKDAFTSDDAAILEAAEEGEDHAVETYGAVLRNGLPADVRDLVRRQYARVKEGHDAVRDRRDARS